MLFRGQRKKLEEFEHKVGVLFSRKPKLEVGDARSKPDLLITRN